MINILFLSEELLFLSENLLFFIKIELAVIYFNLIKF